LRCRFRFSPGKENSLPAFRKRMELLGYDPDNDTVTGDSPAAVGNRIAAKFMAFGWSDGANELHEYKDQTGYESLNVPLVVSLDQISMNDPNHWQPLALDFFITQNDIVIGASVQKYLGANWGWVRPFALVRDDPNDVYDDPGPPPYLGTGTDLQFKNAALELLKFSSWLDPTDSTVIDVSPGARHNNPLGTNDGNGYPVNPFTGEPYEPNLVLRADYGRILAEFWADGPDSETPPGHWNTVANYVTDTDGFVRRFEGVGPELDPLEWDVKLYFAVNGAVSDAAIAAWDAKRKYDYVRPICMIRYMGSKGQSSDENLPSYHPYGLPLVDGQVELITEESSAPGHRHEHLSDHVGEIAVFAWRGEPDIPASEFGGSGWIRAVDWVPYQRSTFVSPPFAAYVSGHSTFSRAAAEVMTAITGSKYFPGGISTFSATAHEFLEFEDGPENDITLTWATYFDAADEAGISRLYGGIHVRADDFGGRIMGSRVGKDAFAKAKTYFKGTASTVDWDQAYDDWVSEMVLDNTQASEPAFYQDDPLKHLSRFFLGGTPIPELAGDIPVKLEFLIPEQKRSLGLDFYLTNGLVNYEYEMQVSYDMVDWATLDPKNDLFTFPEEKSDGLRRIRAFNITNPERDDRQFLRVLVREKY
ncbi:MAG: vanadium-dependent haloperoxidase, partial [Verrucomicrobiae bacterium]|nr:vanadium-dependent haloperoxidase [Verrucomicrobiae bacterium]